MLESIVGTFVSEEVCGGGVSGTFQGVVRERLAWECVVREGVLREDVLREGVVRETGIL